MHIAALTAVTSGYCRQWDRLLKTFDGLSGKSYGDLIKARGLICRMLRFSDSGAGEISGWAKW